MESQSYLIFSLNGQHYAVAISLVREIVWLPELNPVEEAPPYIVGVFNLHNKIVPIMDLMLRFDIPTKNYQLTDHVVILEIKDLVMGIIVNDTHDIVSIPTENIETVPSFGWDGGEHCPQWISGEAKYNNEIIPILNIENIFHYSNVCENQPLKTINLEKTNAFCPNATIEERVIFHKRAQNLLKFEEPQPLNLLPLAVVSLSSEYLGIEVTFVKEFINIGAPTTIPSCPNYIVGNINLRGNILTLLDLRHLLNIQPSYNQLDSQQKKAVVVMVNELLMGITVDEVDDITYAELTSIIEVPSAINSIDKKYLKGTMIYNDKTVTILDLAKILMREDLVVNQIT